MSTGLPIPVDHGAIWDRPASTLPLGVWSDAINMRVNSGTVQTLRGSLAYTLASQSKLYRYGKRIILSTGVGQVRVHSTGVELELNGLLSDVSPVDVEFTDSMLWTLAQYGDTLLLTSPDMHPLVKARTDAVFRKLPGWAAEDRATKVFAYSNYLVAINISRVGVPKPTLVMWSNEVDPENPNAIAWALLSTSNAGENPIASQSGEILDAQELGGVLMLYFRTGVWRMSFIGGGFVFSFNSVFTSDGALGPDCVADISEENAPSHIVLGYSGLYMHNGVTRTYFSEGVQRKYMRRLMDSQKRALVMHYASASEVWVFITTNDSDFDFGFIFNYLTKDWTTFDLDALGGTPLTWVYPAFAVPAEVDTLGLTWNTVSANWNDLSQPWGQRQVLAGIREKIYGIVSPNASPRPVVWITENTTGYLTAEDGTPIYDEDPSLSDGNDVILALEDSSGTLLMEDDVSLILGEQSYLSRATMVVIDSPDAGVNDTPVATLVRDQISLDDLAQDTVMSGKVKQLLRLYPEGEGAGSLLFTVGSRHLQNGSTDLLDAGAFDFLTDYKIDARPTAGKWLYLKIETVGCVQFGLSRLGADLEVVHAR